MLGNHNIFIYRKIFEQTDILKSTCYAHFGDFAGSFAGYFLFFTLRVCIDHVAAGWSIDPGNHIESRRFTCTVRTDQCNNLVFIDLNIKQIYSCHTAKLHCNIISF